MGLETTLTTRQIIHNFHRLANYRDQEAKMHENEATTHEAENEAEAVKFGLDTDPASRT